MSTPTHEPANAGWVLRRDVDAIAAHLDPWILAAGDRVIPVLGSTEWVAAGEVERTAAVAVYVLACLAETEPTVIAARLAAEISAARACRLTALREASHAIAAAGGWAELAHRSHRRVPGPDQDRQGST